MSEEEKLRKWFTKLVEFVRGDQCPPDVINGVTIPCPCCDSFLDVAEHCAKQAGLP